jgi:hypothetical protein
VNDSPNTYNEKQGKNFRKEFKTKAKGHIIEGRTCFEFILNSTSFAFSLSFYFKLLPCFSCFSSFFLRKKKGAERGEQPSYRETRLSYLR